MFITKKNHNKTFNLNLNIHGYILNPQKYTIKDYQEIDGKLVDFLKLTERN